MGSRETSMHAPRVKIAYRAHCKFGLRAATAELPNAPPPALGNVDVFTRVDSRSAGSTYIVTDDPESFRGLQTMSRGRYEALSAMQDAYIAEQEMIQIDGHI